MTKKFALEKIAVEISHCRLCKQGTIGLSVPGEGSANAKIMFIGEAPGKLEAKTGKPFVGRAGQILRKGISLAGLKDKDVYITSPVKYLPKTGTPTPKQIEHGKTHLLKQIETIKPRLIVLLGRVAALAVLNKDLQMTKEHGKAIKQDQRDYFLALHPAAPLHSPKLRKEFFADFKKLVRLINRPTD